MVFHAQVAPETALGGVPGAAQVARRLAAVPGHVLTAPVPVQQQAATPRDGAERGPAVTAASATATGGRTCRPYILQSQTARAAADPESDAKTWTRSN